ncbi:helix-turn-helix domain-containing protein [Kaistella flava (ex Peng et al. 2021)]|uniref:Helix-turn-helix domain-containing protein n=1 Tax=Kaistella flava (ex Peng et al. 2021) TaxID=2038776 RepID=A0A7M2Y922_9FLAO|nr:helix-turn-helix domain-containing protein [Kaistella flava (ex Peng et al. 2021)]QOW10155.1 helix-turn-helix domain-containing protein [Kaistella flava (ex Peng et al. 2021)]
MALEVLTKEDLQQFKIELLESIENLLQGKKTEEKLWLRTSEVKELLNISSGTLQNLRINGTLSYSKIGGTLYYNYNDIQKLLMDFKH